MHPAGMPALPMKCGVISIALVAALASAPWASAWENTTGEVEGLHDLRRAHETPHVEWAKPNAGGRMRVLYLMASRSQGMECHAREAAEFAQRFDVELDTVSSHLRRDAETGAAISGTGVLDFTDGSTSTWNCGFDSGAVIMDLRITGTEGVINIDDFLGQNPDGSADFLYRKGGWGRGTSETITIPSAKPGAALMFEDMAAAAGDRSLRDRWMTATERTQALLDAVWMAALQQENV